MYPYTISACIEDLKTKKQTSYRLTKFFLDQIKIYNPYLNAIAMINPDALIIAKSLDEEREKGLIRSPLHGLPILLKDNILTNDKMTTTNNAFCFKDFIAPYEATIVKKLRDAGCVILGKANLSEFAYFMSDQSMPSGYGSLHGQVVNPYHPKIDPLGSSTGSAVSVAAHMIPAAIGTETNGSLMAPSYQNQVVSIKPTMGLVSRYGIIPISNHQDIAGPIGKTVEDCAFLLDIMVGYDSNDPVTKKAKSFHKDYQKHLNQSIQGIKIGIVEFDAYTYNDIDKACLEKAKSVYQSLGVEVVDLPFKYHAMHNTETLLFDFKHDLNAFLQSLKDYTPMQSLSDIIAFNQKHSDRCLVYGQTLFERALETTDLNDEIYLKKRSVLLHEAKRFQQLMEDEGLSAIISTKWTSYAPVYGNPSVCVPAKPLDDLNPVSLVLVGKRFEDDLLLRIAHQYEQKTMHRIEPPFEKFHLFEANHE